MTCLIANLWPLLPVVQGDNKGVYIMNVAVDARHRGKGVGKLLVQAAAAFAAAEWEAGTLYAHVSPDNQANTLLLAIEAEAPLRKCSLV